jgi:hypothetical protein
MDPFLKFFLTGLTGFFTVSRRNRESIIRLPAEIQ